MARSERTKGPSALQTIKNGSVVSRARSVRTTEDRAVQAAIETIPPSRVKMLDQQQAYQQQQQQSYAPTQQQTTSDNSISAKTIIGTLLGATAGAAIAYAMIKGDSSPTSSSPPTSQSAPAPVPAPAPSQYVQQQPQQQPQQLLQQQPHQMSMSLPMLMPMLGPAPSYQDQQQQQPIYRALEAPPTVLAPSQASRSVYTANDAISAYTRSTAPKSKSPRADTIYEETEYYPPITEGSSRSLYSQEASTINGGSGSSSGVRRTANGSVYATRDLPIRAIEYGMMSTISSSQHKQSQKGRSKSYPCDDPSTFISSYAETRQHQQGHIIGEAESDFSSISTIKPVPAAAAAAKSVMSASSHRSSATKSSKHSSSHRHEAADDVVVDARSTTSSSTRTAHKIALPDSRPGSTYTSATKASKRSSASTIKEIKRDRDRDSLVDAYETPLPASAAPSTVFLDAVVDITPEDSISQVGININNHSTDSKSSSGRSHRSRSGPSSQSQAAPPSTASSKREEATGGSKFDQPIKPSDSISQVSSNHRHSSSHHSHSHSHSHHSSHGHGGGHKGSSRVSERSAGNKSHSGGSRSGHY